MIDREQAIEVLWRSGLGPLNRKQAEHLADAILALLPDLETVPIVWDGELQAVRICDLCGQPLSGDRCNSGVHQGPDDLNGFRGKAVLSTELAARYRITDEMALALIQSFVEDAASTPPGICPTPEEQLRRAHKALDAAISTGNLNS